MLATQCVGERLVWVMGCRADYVGGTSGVPEIAADLIAPPNSAALGHFLTLPPTVYCLTAA
jgi:hypothetical protein